MVNKVTFVCSRGDRPNLPPWIRPCSKQGIKSPSWQKG